MCIMGFGLWALGPGSGLKLRTMDYELRTGRFVSALRRFARDDADRLRHRIDDRLQPRAGQSRSRWPGAAASLRRAPRQPPHAQSPRLRAPHGAHPARSRSASSRPQAARPDSFRAPLRSAPAAAPSEARAACPRAPAPARISADFCHRERLPRPRSGCRSTVFVGFMAQTRTQATARRTRRRSGHPRGRSRETGMSDPCRAR